MELRGIEPLTFSMRTSVLGRLSLLTPLAELRNRWSLGLHRWRQLAADEATADGLRTLRTISPPGGREKTLAVARRQIVHRRGAPHPEMSAHAAIYGLRTYLVYIVQMFDPAATEYQKEMN